MRRLIVLVSLVGAVGCGESTEPCNGAVSMTVSSGTAPTLSWNPACAVAAIVVSEDASSNVMWEVAASANEIDPNVSFGQTPSGASVIVSPTPLTNGVTYTVSLGVILRGSGPPAFLTQRTFIP